MTTKMTNDTPIDQKQAYHGMALREPANYNYII